MRPLDSTWSVIWPPKVVCGSLGTFPRRVWTFSGTLASFSEWASLASPLLAEQKCLENSANTRYRRMAARRTKETRKTLFRGLRVTFSKCSSPKMFSECFSVGSSIKTHLNYPARGLTTPLATVGRNRAPQDTQRVSQNSKIHHRHAFVKKFPEQWHFPRFCPIHARFGPSITVLSSSVHWHESYQFKFSAMNEKSRCFHSKFVSRLECAVSRCVYALRWKYTRYFTVNTIK